MNVEVFQGSSCVARPLLLEVLMHYFVGWPSVLESYCKLGEVFAVCSSEDGETSIVCTSSDVVVFHLKVRTPFFVFLMDSSCVP